MGQVIAGQRVGCAIETKVIGRKCMAWEKVSGKHWRQGKKRLEEEAEHQRQGHGLADEDRIGGENRPRQIKRLSLRKSLFYLLAIRFCE
jgi:hypothetical protein